MPRGLAPADFEGGQQFFRPATYARIVGEHYTTTWRKIQKGLIPVLETADGPRITKHTLMARMGQVPGEEPIPQDRRPRLRPFAKKQPGGQPSCTK